MDKAIVTILKTVRSNAETRRNVWLLRFQELGSEFPEVAAQAKVLADRATGELDAVNEISKLLGLTK
jgi:hypothetical protein